MSPHHLSIDFRITLKAEFLQRALNKVEKVLNCMRSVRIATEVWTKYQVGVTHAAGHQQRWRYYLPIVYSSNDSLKHLPV
jgi:hypothetical protein